jgi:S-adenosylhomocysteine hydrolase
MILPLVESVTDYYQGPYLDKVIIIGVQHVLETTHAMFRSLYKLGLKPQNISIIGKCYSSCKEVYEEMVVDGIDVDPNSFSYSSHESFDEHFQQLVEKFIKERLYKLRDSGIEKIIILDDGGKCIELIQKNMEAFPPLVAIEQTSSGYEAIRSIALDFPVINVARTSTKLTLESPMIAKAAVDRLFLSLKSRKQVGRALILGGGPIGLAVKQKLSEHEILADIYDIKESKENLSDLLGKYSLILGCTGKTSIPKEYHGCFASKTILASISSSDREFDAAYLRKKVPETKNCHKDLNIGGITLIRNGFPVNFDGERENIDPELIQLTIALMTAGILQGVEQDLLASKGVISLRKQAVEFIEDAFVQLVSSDQI